MIVGVIIANMIAKQNVKGTTALFCQLGNMWGITTSALLGSQYKPKPC